MFTILVANSGFWQIPLDDNPKVLTTFITPFDRYCFNRLPFRVSSEPEIFQCTRSAILKGLDRVICWMDDILIHSRNEVEHDTRVWAVLFRLQKAGLTLNIQKCEFSQGRIKFLGTLLMLQQSEEECVQVRRCCQEGWPMYMPQQPLLRPYWKNRAYLAVVDDLVLYDECIVVPQALRLKILDCIHHGHLGISKCCARARVLVW